MEKTNIIFNDKNYSIDTSSLSAATAALQAHLSTTMNGTGAVVNFGGVSYNIDSTKLSTAKNDFVSHLGAIAGNGAKVTVGGVEYAIDAAKISDSISELETIFGNLDNPTVGGNVAVLDEAVLDFDVLG